MQEYILLYQAYILMGGWIYWWIGIILVKRYTVFWKKYTSIVFNFHVSKYKTNEYFWEIAKLYNTLFNHLLHGHCSGYLYWILYPPQTWQIRTTFFYARGFHGEFGQSRAGMAYLCFTMSGTSVGRTREWECCWGEISLVCVEPSLASSVPGVGGLD